MSKKVKRQIGMKSRISKIVSPKKSPVQRKQPLPVGKGLDVGTAFIYASEKIGDEVVFRIERDAFLDIPVSDHIKGILERDNVKYIRKGDQFYVVGNGALRFANLFQRNVRRPLEQGIINPKEKDALPIIKLLLENAVGSCYQAGETIYYSVPAQPIDADFDVLYHERIISNFLSGLGYAPKSINEGLAVVFSELAEENFTGLAFSFGGGMVNVCLANLSMPILSFSIARGGDWIDKQVARVVGEPISIVTSWKESFLDLNKREDMSRMEQALSIYYDILLDYVVGHLKTELEKSVVHLEKPLTIILSGGTAKPSGFLKRFEETLKRFPLSVELGEIRLASQPLHSVAKGALIAAIVDESKKQ